MAYLRLLVLVSVASACLTPLPHPTATIPVTGAAGEISQSQAVAPSSTSNQEQHFVKLDQLTLKGQTGVSASELENIIAVIKQIPYDKSRWRDELQNTIREEWQRRGYFRVSVQYASVEDSPALNVVSRVRASFVVNAGPLFRLKGISFQNNIAFSSDELRAMFPIKDGDIFDLLQFSTGLTHAKSAYRNKGFEEFYAIPSFDLHDKAGLIKCIVQVDEGKNVQHLH